MTFKDAKKELKKLADGKYHSMNYELTEYRNGDQRTQCLVYGDGYSWFSAPTWEEALAKLRKAMGLSNGIDETEAPE